MAWIIENQQGLVIALAILALILSERRCERLRRELKAARIRARKRERALREKLESVAAPARDLLQDVRTRHNLADDVEFNCPYFRAIERALRAIGEG